MSDELRKTRRGLLAAAAGTSAVGAAGCLDVTTPADLAAATHPQGHVGYLVGVDWARERRDQVVFLDARQERLFREERIRGARLVSIDRIGRRSSSEDGLIPDTNGLADALGDLGVARDTDVIVYGASVGARVTRTVFALHALGHAGDIHILNGGMRAWTGRLGTGGWSAPTVREYEPEPDPSTWVTREWIADRIGSFNADGPGLIDVRVPEAYIAATGSPALDERHERHGHVPGAVNVHWLGNIDGGMIADPGELFERYTGGAGLSTEEPVVVYGDENVEATQTWVTLRAIGFEDVRLYEGGFTEWANVDADRGRYPVETGTTAVIETDGDAGVDDGGDFTCT